MGISTDAILYYGVDVWNPEEDVDDWLLKAVMATDDPDEDEGEDDLYEALEKACRGREGVGWGTHCHHDYPIYYLCTFERRANRGYPSPIGVNTEEPHRDHVALIRLLRDLKAPDAVIKKVGWYLASDWT